MYIRPEPDPLLHEFKRERSVRRAAHILDAKRQRLRRELKELVEHLTLLVPLAGVATQEDYLVFVQEAASRLGDDAFAQLLLKILSES